MKRIHAIAVVILLLLLFLLVNVPAPPAPAPPPPLPTITTVIDPAFLNETEGPGSPIAYRQFEPEITLLNLESNQTTFPGPRSMAFGPRRIGFSANARQLIIVATVTCTAALIVMLYQKKKEARDMAARDREMDKDDDRVNGP